MTTTDGARLEAEAVEKRFGSVTALGAVSLTVEPGRALAIRGGNGTGKTTLLHCLAGRTTPTAGEVLLDGAPIDERRPPDRRDIAFLSGAAGLFRDLTIADHLTLIDSTWGRDPATGDDRVAAALDAARLTRLAGRFPHELSSGQAQLVQLLLALFRPARLVVLDEPEQRLDADRRALVGDLLAARRDAGTTVVIATHDARLADRVADDVLTLEPAGA